MTNETLTACKELLKKQEGLRLKTYRCTAGALTIGFGRNLDAKGISRDEAELMFENDVNLCVEQVKKEFGTTFDNLTPSRQSVLVNMCFNLGIGGLMGFKRTIAHIRSGSFDLAATEMLNSRWATQVKNRANVLSEMMRRG